MALFQRKPDAGHSRQLFSLGNQQTVLLVGLGNPGEQYEKTRHNAGFIALDHFVNNTADFSDWINKKDLKCLLAQGQIGSTRVIAIKPQTFMNLSGEAVQAVAHFYKIDASKIIAIYDDIDVNFGQVRTRLGGGSAGHNGVKSLTQHIGENFGRVRIGIGPKTHPDMPSEAYVLQPFSTEQQAHLNNMSREVTALITEHLVSGQNLTHETRSFLV